MDRTTPQLPPYEYLRDGAAIYAESFAMIRRETRLEHLPEDVAHVALRMVHASAQPDIVDDLRWSPGVVTACRAALAAGAPILCDSTMVAHGVIRSKLPADNEVVCRLADPGLPELARRLGTTKAAAAVELWADRLAGSVVVIGNAPTALFQLLESIGAGGPRPAAIIGIPVGFVGADRSKEALADNPWGLEYLTLLGRRGGSAVAAAAVNAMSI
ncbi:precorrin-8X methylmutase [Raineyella sp.]|uniref:precorrin-8X methylmutase n=1 Tax=Raineyella sp. TaxID=1911550 RepID=UPI002B21E8C6|nr:precorrin-8X methylmutase [Raineyella sp.]MEA5155483.1 precorrin-8X methylmutase [Raineyella sp.]